MEFVRGFLEAVDASAADVVLDPWNGSGTTTLVAAEMGLESVGTDLNPVMMVIAKGRLARERDRLRLRAYVREIIATTPTRPSALRDCPLLQWFDAPTAGRLRALEMRLRALRPEADENESADIEAMTVLQAHLYTGMFVTVRSFLTEFMGTNPTWVRRPTTDCRINLRWSVISKAFASVVDEMPLSGTKDQRIPRFEQASTMDLSRVKTQPTIVLTSPPYCTRIDYAVATRPELAVLGISLEDQDDLRRQMLGTTTVPRSLALDAQSLGDLAVRVLDNVSHHTSRASSTYYWKWLAQYFNGYADSMAEITRLMSPGATMAVVVQDSYYKNIHIDLPAITAEMGKLNGLELTREYDYCVPRTMAGINTRSRKYRNTFSAMEKVMIFSNSPSLDEM